MYRYAVSFIDQAYSNVRDTVNVAKADNTASNTQNAVNGSGEVYATNLKDARVTANEKFVDKTIKNIIKENTSGSFYA